MTLRLPPLLDADGLPLFSLREINRLPAAEKTKIYAALVPDPVFDDYDIDRETRTGRNGEERISIAAPEGLGLVRIDARRSHLDRDSLFFVEIADTPYNQIELSFCFINDPDAPRFNVDVDAQGRENLFGTVRRNLSEELRAMQAGLFPHQVRRGLRMFVRFLGRFETFVERLGIDLIVAEPLSYDNAVRYEGYGFDYLAGKQLMLQIDREFAPGGELYRRLDGSTPFRMPGAEKTMHGRSWAIHDGILDVPWDGIRIYKRPGHAAGVNTFPGRIAGPYRNDFRAKGQTV